MDRAREARRQALMIDRLAARQSPRIARAIAEEMILAGRIYGETGVVVQPSTDRLVPAYNGLIQTAVAVFAEDLVAKSGGRLETKGFADFMRRVALEYIGWEAIRRRIVAVAETTRAQIVRQVDKGYREGLGQHEIGRLIQERSPQIAQARANLIARTETHGAANFGAHRAAEDAGLPFTREWVSVEDHRTRDFGEGDGIPDEYNHRSMNGQTRGMKEAFQMPSIGGQFIPAMFPGDPDLPAAASINCRCAVTHVVGFESFL